MASKHDIWMEWLLNRRFGGNAEVMTVWMEQLFNVRDKVLSHANLKEHETLLDVGCGDGLIAFGALEKVASSRVIFSDISRDLLTHVQSLVEEMALSERCEYVQASADDLSPFPDASVEVVTLRSVLIYVPAKQKAFQEFYRVLKPGGSLSIFEPINRFAFPEPDHNFDGYDITPVIEATQKIKAIYARIQPSDSDPMLDFDERDLLTSAEKAGFQEIHLELQVEIKPKAENIDWETLIHVAPNPKVPTLEEAMQEVLTPAERQAFIAHLRPLVEAKQGVDRSALAYLWAIK